MIINGIIFGNIMSNIDKKNIFSKLGVLWLELLNIVINYSIGFQVIGFFNVILMIGS